MSAADASVRAVLDTLPDAVVVVAADGTVAVASGLATRLVGAGPLEGRDAAEALALVDEAGQAWWACRRPLDDTHADRIPEVDLTLDTAGGARPVSVTARRGGDGRLVVVLRRGERRQRLDAARGELVSTVSHELRSPLTSVKGFTKTLLAKWDRFTDAQKQAMLAVIDDDADRVTRLLGELLDVSRIDAGRLQVHRQMIDIEAIAAKVAERHAPEDATRPIDVHLTDVPSLYADPDKVEQMITNLVENAVKYGAGPTVIDAEVGSSEVVVSVTDRGPGVDPAHRRAIFKKFFRKPGERRSGTGLGLFITKGLVEGHGGRIWVADAEPGARFSFTLPLGGLELAGIDTQALRRSIRPTTPSETDR